jgi:hypothetical protein
MEGNSTTNESISLAHQHSNRYKPTLKTTTEDARWQGLSIAINGATVNKHFEGLGRDELQVMSGLK